HESQARQGGVNEVQNGGDKQEEKFNRFGDASHHRRHHAGDQKPADFFAVFRMGRVINRQGDGGQSEQEGGHFSLGQELGGLDAEMGHFGTGELLVKDVEGSGHRFAADDGRAARLREADQGDQNVVQAEGKQQPFAGAEQEGTGGSRFLNQRPDSADRPSKQRPDQRHRNPDDGHHQGGDDRDKAGAAEERSEERRVGKECRARHTTSRYRHEIIYTR